MTEKSTLQTVTVGDQGSGIPGLPLREAGMTLPRGRRREQEGVGAEVQERNSEIIVVGALRIDAPRSESRA